MSEVYKNPRLYTSSIIQAFHVARVTKKTNANIVTIYTTRVGALIPFLRYLMPKLVINYCTYADPFINPDFYKRHHVWYKKAITLSDNVFSSSAYCASAIKIFTQAVIPKVIYVGVDTDRFYPVSDISEPRIKLGLSKDKNIILFVGRMEAEMGADSALNIAIKMVVENDDITFVIVGAEGALTEVIKQKASQFEGRIICRVNVPAKDLPHYYAAATLIIAPTLGAHACMGVSIKEAMSSGKPTVVSNSGGIPEAVRHDIDGLIVPLDDKGKIDINGFDKAVKLIIDNKNIRQNFGENARTRAIEIFSNQSTLREYVKLLTI
jgi:glycosyltransferase involved in cell wall biosynthesis